MGFLQDQIQQRFLQIFFFLLLGKKLDKKIKKTDIRRARRFANTFKFIDYLSGLNDDGEFESFR